MKTNRNTIFILLTLFLLTCILGCSQFKMKCYAKDFVKEHPELSDAKKTAILNQKVILGMYPDEAHAAAGGFSYSISDAPGYKEPHDYYPPKLIFSQKENPTPQYIIKMGFSNKTQYDSEQPIGFWVYFENGKAVKIEKN